MRARSDGICLVQFEKELSVLDENLEEHDQRFRYSIDAPSLCLFDHEL